MAAQAWVRQGTSRHGTACRDMARHKEGRFFGAALFIWRSELRYYDIQLGSTEYSSLFGGVSDPGALNIELDFPLSTQARPMGEGWLRVWGVGVGAINQAASLANQPILVRGGMSAGLPLANPAEQGTLIQG